MDEQLRDICNGLGIRYISPVKLLCTGTAECLTMAAGTPESVMNFDVTHLTDAGSVYLVGKMKDEIQKKHP